MLARLGELTSHSLESRYPMERGDGVEAPGHHYTADQAEDLGAVADAVIVWAEPPASDIQKFWASRGSPGE